MRSTASSGCVFAAPAEHAFAAAVDALLGVLKAGGLQRWALSSVRASWRRWPRSWIGAPGCPSISVNGEHLLTQQMVTVEDPAEVFRPLSLMTGEANTADTWKRKRNERV
jgi:hypothetical protein